MPDIFDQIHAEATGSAAPAPMQGDIFDQIHSESQQPAYQPPASPAEYFRTHANMDPLAVEQAYSQLGHQNQPAVVQTPEMISRQGMQRANQERGFAGNALGGFAQNYSGLAGGFQRALAAPVGLVAPGAAENMRMAAAQSEAYGPQEGSWVGTAGNLVGGLPAAILPGGSLINATNTGEQAYENIEARKAAGENISGADETANVAGQAALSGLITKLGQKNITGNLVTRFAPAAVTGNVAGRLATKAIGGAAFNAAGHLASQGIQKVTTDPNTDVTAGVGRAAALGAGMDMAGGLIHEYAGQHPSQAPPLEPVVANRAEGGNEARNQASNEGVHTPDDRLATTPTEQGKENVPSIEGQPALGEAQPSVQEARPAEGQELPAGPKPEAAAGDGPVPHGVEGATPKPLPELPAEHAGWSYKQLKDWAGENGFDTEGVKGKLTLRTKMGDQLLAQEKSLRRTEPLTQAPNVIKYHEDADRIFKDADAKNEHTALVETDIGGLKVMNTVYGHEGGDTMLKMAAHAMREELRVPPQRNGRSEDYLGSSAYRTGGDEFPLILRNIKDSAGAKVVMDRVNKNFDAKLAKQFPDLPPEARPFIAWNAEIRKPGDTRDIHDMRKIADAGVEPVKTEMKKTRQIPEGRTDLLNYIKKRQQEMAVPKGDTNVPETGTPGRLTAGRSAGAVAVPESVEKLFERDVRPAVEKTKTNLGKTWDSINRAVGTGLNLKPEEYDTSLNLRTSLGKQELERTRTEADLKPYRDILDKQTPAQKAQWVDQVEATGSATDKATQPAADLMNRLNKRNIAEGEKYGINTSKWDADYIGRLFKFEGEPAGSGNRTSIAGPQNFLKGRTFDTYSDALKFVEANGGKPLYDNPLDMALAKQTEIRRSVEARKAMYGEENRGMAKWAEDGKPAPDGMEAKLNDRLAQQERDVIAPKWVFAKLAGMQHLDAEKYMEGPEWSSQTQTLRPGDDLPEGMVRTGQSKKGHYVANENVAGLFNNLISPGVTKAMPVWDQVVAMKRGVVAANLGLSAVHAVLESVGNAVQSIGRSLSNASHGEFDLAAKNLVRANPVSMGLFGKRIREQVANPSAHPQLEPLVQTSVEGGNKFGLKSVLTKSDWQSAKEEWAAGNKIGAVPRILKSIYGATHKPLFEHFIPALRAGAKAAEAEMAIRRGLTGDELQRHMGRSQEDIDNILGTVIRSNQFQNKMVTDVQDLIFTAPKFTEGTLRFAGAATRDIAKAFKDVASGTKPTMTPAMYTTLAGLMAHALGGAAIQMAYTYATTGKAQRPTQLQDYIAPRTGRKDDQGRDERISLMSPFSALFSFAKGGGKAVASRVAPIWHGVGNAISNVDEHGVEIRGRHDTLAQKVGETAKYLGKQALPFSVQNLMESQKPGASKTPDARIGDVLGAHFSHTSSSKAEQEVRDIMSEDRRTAPLTKEEAAKGDRMRELVGEVKGKTPTARTDVIKSARAGDINPGDVQQVYKRAAEKPGLQGLLKRSSVSAADIMDRVWPVMTPDERKSNQWMVRGRIGTSTLSPVEKQKLFKQISSDMKGGAK